MGLGRHFKSSRIASASVGQQGNSGWRPKEKKFPNLTGSQQTNFRRLRRTHKRNPICRGDQFNSRMGIVAVGTGGEVRHFSHRNLHFPSLFLWSDHAFAGDSILGRMAASGRRRLGSREARTSDGYRSTVAQIVFGPSSAGFVPTEPPGPRLLHQQWREDLLDLGLVDRPSTTSLITPLRSRKS